MAKVSVSNRLSGLDFLRAAAITFVFVFHYGHIFPHPEWTGTISKFGWTGVDLFFVLSGFLIASQLFEKINRQQKIVLREFFLKRFFRIIPPYLLVVIIYFLLPASREHEALAPFWKYLTFTQNLGLDLRNQGTFSHAWSLCIEEQFYLFFPLILVLLVYFRSTRKGAVILLLLFLSGFAIRWICWHALIEPYQDTDTFGVRWYKWIYYPTFCRLDGLLAGVSIAALFRFRPTLRKRIEQYGNLLLGISVVMLAAAYYLCLNEQSFYATVFGFPLVDISYGVMVMGAVCPTSMIYNLRSVNIARLATFSYAIYLTHKIVIHCTQEECFKLGISRESNLMFLICILTCLLAAFLVRICVERPFLKWRDQILAKYYIRS